MCDDAVSQDKQEKRHKRVLLMPVPVMAFCVAMIAIGTAIAVLLLS